MTQAEMEKHILELRKQIGKLTKQSVSFSERFSILDSGANSIHNSVSRAELARDLCKSSQDNTNTMNNYFRIFLYATGGVILIIVGVFSWLGYSEYSKLNSEVNAITKRVREDANNTIEEAKEAGKAQLAEAIKGVITNTTKEVQRNVVESGNTAMKEINEVRDMLVQNQLQTARVLEQTQSDMRKLSGTLNSIILKLAEKSLPLDDIRKELEQTIKPYGSTPDANQGPSAAELLRQGAREISPRSIDDVPTNPFPTTSQGLNGPPNPALQTPRGLDSTSSNQTTVNPQSIRSQGDSNPRR